MVLPVFGMILAGYLLFEQSTHSPFQICNVNSAVNCNAIISGAVSTTYGIPTPLIGLIGYIFIFISAIFRLRKFLLAFALFGVAFCLWIFSKEIFQLHVVCPICVLCQIDMLLIVILAFTIVAKEKDVTYEK